VLWTGFIWLWIGANGGCCENSNKPSGSVNCSEILEYVSDLRLLKKDSAPWR
jgi:hypothetical protein